MIVNRADLASTFGVALTTVDAWRRDGCPVESGSGKRGVAMQFDTAKVFKWLMERTGDTSTQAQIEKEKLRELRRKNDIEESLVAPVSLLTEAIVKTASQVKPILESLPLIMKRNWPEITGDQITLVKKAIAECLNAIADMEVEI